jgi:hypothetical protein
MTSVTHDKYFQLQKSIRLNLRDILQQQQRAATAGAVGALRHQLERWGKTARRARRTTVADVINDYGYGMGIVHLAIATDNVDIVSLMLQHGADLLWTTTRSGQNGVQYAALYAASPRLVDTVLAALPTVRGAHDADRLFIAIVRTTTGEDFFGMLSRDFACPYRPANGLRTLHTRMASIHKLLDRIERYRPAYWPRDWLLHSALCAKVHHGWADEFEFVQATDILRRRHAMQSMHHCSCLWLFAVWACST